jgi:hypothetical protein
LLDVEARKIGYVCGYGIRSKSLIVLDKYYSSHYSAVDYVACGSGEATKYELFPHISKFHMEKEAASSDVFDWPHPVEFSV